MSDQSDIFSTQPENRKTAKWIKYTAGTALTVILLVGGAGLIVPHVIDQQKYKTLIVEKVSEATGYTLDWKGDIGFSTLPLPHVSVNELTLSAQDQTILSVKSVDVSVNLASLLSGKIDISDISLNTPKISLVTAKDGRQLWMTDRLTEKNTSTPETENKTEKESGAGTAMPVSLGVVKILDGDFLWDDQSSGAKQQLSDIDVNMSAESLQGPFELDGNLVWNGHKIEAKLNTPEMTTEEGVYPLQLKMALPEQNILMEYSGVIDGKGPLSVNGDISLDMPDTKAAIESFTGTKDMSLPKELSGKTSLSAKLSYTPEKLALSQLRLDLGELGYGGDFAVTGLGGTGASPTVSFGLESNKKADDQSSPILKFMDDLSISAAGKLDGDTLVINNSQIKLDENSLALAGSVALGGDGKNANKQVDLTCTIGKLDIDRIREKLGMASPSATEKGKDSAGTKNKAEDSSATQTGFNLPFDGKLKVEAKEIVYDGKSYKNITANILSTNGRLDISNVSADIPGGISADLSGRIGNTAELSGMDLTIAARVNDVEATAQEYGAKLPELPKKIGAATLQGKLTGSPDSLGFDMTVGAWSGKLSAAGTLAHVFDSPVVNQLDFALSHPDFGDVMRIIQPGFTASGSLAGPVNLKGKVAWENEAYHVTGLSGNIGRTTLAGNLDVATSGKPSVTGTMAIGDLAMGTNQAGGASSGNTGNARGKGGPSASSGARWSREAIDVAWMKNFNADLKLSAKSIRYDMWEFSGAALNFVLKDGTLTIEDMSANLFGGKASVKGQIKSGAGEHDPLNISGSLAASNVDARGLQSALTGKNSDTLSGTISSVEASIESTGLSPAALIQTLSGHGTASGRDIIVKGVDAAQLATAAKGSYKPLDRAGTLFGSFGEGQTEFSTFESAFDIRNGIVDFSKILFDGPRATLSSTGNVNLPLWTINLTNTMTVKNTDIPPFTFTVKGPLDNPSKAGGDVIENYLRSKVEKKVNKLIEKELGKFLGGSTAPEPTPTPEPIAPTDGSVPTQDAPAQEQTAPAPSSEKPEDILKNEAAKALGGLLGQ